VIGSREKKRFDALRELGCIACKRDLHWRSPEIHHLVDNGYRKHSGGHQATIPLCDWHHRGTPIEGHALHWMRSQLGPSMALESKAFAERYGSQRELLAKVNELLAGKP
jgi:hypothetical protein